VAANAKDLIQAVSERQLAMERQLDELAGAIKTLQVRVAELSQPPALQPAAAPAAGVKAAATAVKQADHGEVTPEMLVVIAAAVTAFLGKKVRIRSAKMLQSPYQVVNLWSQQGRMLIHASHHPRIKG
jgi:methylmalonyl-CoA carboxyltransferase large subunit